MTIDTETGHASPTRPALAVSARTWPWLAMAIVLVTAVVLRHMLSASTDVSWLLTAGERVLAGHRLYADVIETNPPMAVLAYLPGILIARLLGIAAETAVDALVFAAIGASLALSARVLKRVSVLQPGQGWPLALLAFAVLAVLPTQTFGQREHIALIALLPMLVVAVVRSEGSVPSRAEAIVAGLGAAVALSFKPHFAIALLAAWAIPVIARRSLRVLFGAEVVTVAVAMMLYAALVVIVFPEFLSVITPLVRDVYLPVHQPLAALLVKPAMWLWALALLTIFTLMRRTRMDAPLQVVLAASLGFAVVFVLQRKGWPYHSYPMLALALLGCGWALINQAAKTATDRALGVGGVIVLAALFARSMLWFNMAFDARPLQDRVARLGLAHPAILAITAEPGIGHPLVRALGGSWVSRQQALWVATYLDVMRSEGPIDPAFEVYATRERAMLLEDLRRMPPDVVLVDDLTGHATAWMNAHPETAALLRDFERVDSVNQVGIWRRK
ncbi:MAG: hypothetical protein ABW213_10115 [Tardiphaga sp.]